MGDWFESLADVLHWNLRKPQSKINVERQNLTNDESLNSSDDNKTNQHLSASSTSASESSIDDETSSKPN